LTTISSVSLISCFQVGDITVIYEESARGISFSLQAVKEAAKAAMTRIDLFVFITIEI
jgi:hypothetical protein